MKHKKVDIESNEPIESIAEVDRVVDAFVKRGGYITIEEDLKIRKRIPNGNHLASWIRYVKSKLIYKTEKIAKHKSVARTSIKRKVSSKNIPSKFAKPLANEGQAVKVVVKRSLVIDNYFDICKEDSSLRPYQQKAKKEIFESWDEVDNVMFQMPTGTGKTRLFTSIIRDINQYSLSKREAVKILIIAHRTELIDQIDESLKKYHVAHNVIGGSKKKRDEDQYVKVSTIKEIAQAKMVNEKKFPVHVASIQTIMHKRNLNDAQKLNFQFIIIDEAHHALAETYKKLWDLYPGSKKLGVTATPWRMNHQSFTDLFDKLVMSMPIKDFIKQGYLSPYVYYSLRDESYIQKAIDGIELNEFGEYDEESMEENMDIGKIRAQLLSSYQSLAKDKKGIIYAINKKHAKNIKNEYEEAGYRVVAIDSETPYADRNEMVKSFKQGEIDIIVNVDIFSEGFDCPDIEFIQLARPTRSLVKYLQQVGRGLRITENKGHCIILDNVGMYSRFGLPDARRHWKYHFLGHDVEDEEETMRSSSKERGNSRNQDLSEGTEDMELIQDISGDVEIIESKPDSNEDSSSAIDNFFPLFDITLGKTTWKDAKEMGIKVSRFEKEESRSINVENVDFWDHDGVGIFTSLYWTRDESDFPVLWNSKGFDWNLSYDKWIEVFEKLGFEITITRQPSQKKYSQRNTLCAEFEALSSDKTLRFIMDFNFGENGYYTSSPKTLYSITVDYKGELAEETQSDQDEAENGVSTQIVDDVVKPTNHTSSSLDDFFPLFGVTLGKTTWKDVENLGYKVKIFEKGPDRYTHVEDVAFWDHTGIGVFTSLYLTRDWRGNDMSSLWKSKGFYWNLSYDEWIGVFQKLGYSITIKEEPCQKVWKGNNVLSAEFEALSSDKTLRFIMDFNYGENGFYTSSPGTLFGITVKYLVEITDRPVDIVIPNEEEYDESQQGSRCLIYNDDKTEVIGCDENDCENLIIPEGVTTIAKDVFKNNTKIKTVSFPESLISIGSSAFRGCTGITQIALNDNLEKIGFDAFRWTSLRSVEIPSDVNDISMSAFNCEMHVVETNIDFVDLDGVLYNYYETKLIIYPSLKLEKHYDVPDGIEVIDAFAFEDSFLQSVSLPITIENLRTNIFNGCTNLTTITIYVEDPINIEVHKDCFNGFEKKQCKLIVPAGCKAKYSSHPMFNDFLSIVEMNTEEDEEVQKPSVPIDPNVLDKIFEKKATSYKYFWFMAIITLAKEKKSLTITYKDIVIRMAALAWPIVFEYEIDLGKIDMISKCLNEILRNSTLIKGLSGKVVEAYLSVYYESDGIDKILEPLLKNVPYRFLSPWIPYTTDKEVMAESNYPDCACLYSLHENNIVLNEEWWEYIKKNYTRICYSTERSFITYAKQKNKHNSFTKFMAKGWSML